MNYTISNEPFGNETFRSVKKNRENEKWKERKKEKGIRQRERFIHNTKCVCKHAICLSHRHSAARRHHHFPLCDTIEITLRAECLAIIKNANALARR